MPSPIQITPRVSSFLDCARWVSAEIVVFGHIRSMMWADWANLAPDQQNRFTQVVYFVASLGHQAVMVFFVLSGFLVGGSALNDLLNGRFSLGRYLINRVSRLYVVLIPALILGGLLDAVGSRWFTAGGVYSHGWPQTLYSLDFSVVDRLGWQTAGANLLYLQTITAATFGSNGPLWSLANEFWYYVLFPLLAVPVLAGRRILGKVHWLAAGVAVAALIYPEILEYGAIWLLGALARICPRALLPSRWIGLVAIPLAMALSTRVPHWFKNPQAIFASDLAVGVVIALTLTALVHDGKSRPLPGGRVHTDLANFSFSLYLLHFPLLVFLATWLESTWQVGIGRPPLAGSSLLGFLLMFIVLNLYAWSVSLVTERHTPVVRGWLIRRLLPPTVAPGAQGRLPPHG